MLKNGSGMRLIVGTSDSPKVGDTCKHTCYVGAVLRDGPVQLIEEALLHYPIYVQLITGLQAATNYSNARHVVFFSPHPA